MTYGVEKGAIGDEVKVVVGLEGAPAEPAAPGGK
jgi:hypothetical protein